jgi:hypothetical protein
MRSIPRDHIPVWWPGWVQVYRGLTSLVPQYVLALACTWGTHSPRYACSSLQSRLGKTECVRAVRGRGYLGTYVQWPGVPAGVPRYMQTIGFVGGMGEQETAIRREGEGREGERKLVGLRS